MKNSNKSDGLLTSLINMSQFYALYFVNIRL